MKKVLFLICLMLTTVAFAKIADECSDGDTRIDVYQADKWYRFSAEQRALYNQAYSLATLKIENWSRSNPRKKSGKWGVILDIDETALNNSWYFAQCRNAPKDATEFSKYIVLPEKSTALPGVKEFVEAVHRSNGYVTLLSNRDGSSYGLESGDVVNSTIHNLDKEGIYYDQVVFANIKAYIEQKNFNPEDKNPRFEAIASGICDITKMVCYNKHSVNDKKQLLGKHEIVAYFGDNIQDFPNLKQEKVNKWKPNDARFKDFGVKYFIFPNPIYGSWEKIK